MRLVDARYSFISRMSADLFEAFVGSQDSSSRPKEADPKHSPGLLIQPDSPPRPEDTWQAWPTATETVPKSHSKQQSQTLWETVDNGNDVLFDAGRFDADSGPSANDDDFGDFEEAVTQRSDDHVFQVENQLATADLLNLETEELAKKGTTETESPLMVTGPARQSAPVIGRFSQIAPHEEITTLGSYREDDWGDFETTEVRSKVAGLPHQHEALQKATAPVGNEKSSTVRTKSPRTIMPSPSDLKFDSAGNEDFGEEPWDNLDNDEPDKTDTPNNLTKPPRRQDLFESGVAAEVVQRDRPANVPPPTVLLSWLPKVFSALATQARQSHTETVAGVSALQAYRVSARVIAGRAARWKRDTILAQSMRIGAAGRSGGMKLTALDKGESRKEDQAAEEVLASWNRVSHVLNAAIIRAKAQKPPMALSSKLSARMATGLDVVSATHICAICGLRRNERVVGIDVSVSDTFGEFWVEHWGHKDCADTWYGFNKLLDQR